jgi:integrase
MVEQRKKREGRRFTEISIRALKPEADRYEIRDLNAQGLYVAVAPTGHKSFVVRYRFKGEPRKLSLGNIPLSKARKAATAALDDVKEGRDPSAAKQEAKAEKRIVNATTFRLVAEQYLKLAGTKLRTADRQAADLERLVFPTLGDRPITEIKRSEIVALLDQIEMGELVTAEGEPIKGGPVAADRCLALIRRIMGWHATRTDNFAPPIVRGMARTKGKERARDRILSDDEIRKVVNAASKAETPFAAFIQFLLLTGARRSEASELTWHEIKDGIWTLPPSRNKTKIALARPLSAAALAVIESQRREGGGQYVFSTDDGKTPISAFSKFKQAFDKASGTSGWTLHDCRRSARSLMSRAGVDSDHAERCLGHVISGVRSVYDRHSFQQEMTRAYDALADLVARIANPPSDNVTPMKKRGAR